MKRPLRRLIAAGLLAAAGVAAHASSHREALAVLNEPCADNTDTYAWVAPGTHLNAVGAHTPTTRELDSALVRDARVVGDSREAVLAEKGDCLIPLAEGAFGPEHVSDEIGDVLLGRVPGRTSPEQITAYMSCGLAVQDVAAARLVHERAVAAGVGVEVAI